MRYCEHPNSCVFDRAKLGTLEPVQLRPAQIQTDPRTGLWISSQTKLQLLNSSMNFSPRPTTWDPLSRSFGHLHFGISVEFNFNGSPGHEARESTHPSVISLVRLFQVRRACSGSLQTMVVKHLILPDCRDRPPYLRGPNRDPRNQAGGFAS